jgi:hypothetical protein
MRRSLGLFCPELEFVQLRQKSDSTYLCYKLLSDIGKLAFVKFNYESFNHIDIASVSDCFLSFLAQPIPWHHAIVHSTKYPCEVLKKVLPL